MAINHSELKKALKIMTEAPDSIRRANDRYKEKLSEIKVREQSGQWSPNSIKSDRERAKNDRDIVVGRLMDQMKSAIYTIDANNSTYGETFDFSDPKFQSAISFISIMGRDMSPVDQINLLENFRGNPGALNALGSAMKKNNLYFSGQAREMTKTIPSQALQDAIYVVNKYEFNGEIDLERMRWTGGEFKKAAERYGYDTSSDPDPYVAALIDARDLIPVSDDEKEQARNTAAKWKIDSAIKELNTAKATGKGNREEIFTKAVRNIETVTSTATVQSAEA